MRCLKRKTGRGKFLSSRKSASLLGAAHLVCNNEGSFEDRSFLAASLVRERDRPINQPFFKNTKDSVNNFSYENETK